MNVGIIGLGYVGSACESLFKDYFHLETLDIVKDSTCNSTEEIAKKSEIIFICLPTPMRKDGSCDLSIIDNVLSDLNDCSQNNIVVIKSTVEVGTTDRFEKKYQNLKFIFNPEFLTEANFIEDFKNQNRIIIGSNNTEVRNRLVELYSKIFNDSEVAIKTTTTVNAEMVKYITNTFLAVKVSFANEIAEISSIVGADFDKSVELARLDKRLGDSHWNVPGPDGKKGFGGSCFPKDINSLLHVFESKKINSFILKAAWERNILVDRPEKDWADLKGRAVSKEDD